MMIHQIRKELRKLAIINDVKIVYKVLPKWVGLASVREGIIEISTKNNISRVDYLCTFFHELNHIKCFRRGLYKNYHDNTISILYFKTALKAERYVDKMAANDLTQYDSSLIYDYPYSDNSSVKYFKNILKERYDRYKNT